MFRKLTLICVLLLAVTLLFNVGVQVCISQVPRNIMVSFDAKLDVFSPQPPLDISVWFEAEVLYDGEPTHPTLPANTVTLQLLVNGSLVNSYLYPYSLPVGSKFTYTYKWVPTAEGKYNLTAYVPPLAWETIRDDNVEWDVVPIFEPIVNPRVYVDPPSITVYKGEIFTARVNIANLSDLYVRDQTMYDIPLGNFYGADFYFYYDSSKLAVLDFTMPIWWIFADNSTAGTFYVLGTSYPPEPPLNNYPYPGSTTVLEITFRATATGIVSLSLPIGNMMLVDKDGRYIGRDAIWEPTYLSATYGSVRIKIVGDVNGDGIVDFRDLYALGRAYGSVSGSGDNWNRECDFNRDNKVDYLDLSALLKNYGKTE